MWVFLSSTRAQVSGPPFCSSFPRETTTFTYTRASGPTLEGGGEGGVWNLRGDLRTDGF